MTFTTDTFTLDNGHKASIEWHKEGAYTAEMWIDNGTNTVGYNDIVFRSTYATREKATAAIRRKARAMGATATHNGI